MTREERIELEVLDEIAERCLAVGLEVTENNIRLVATLMMDEFDPLPNDKSRTIITRD